MDVVLLKSLRDDTESLRIKIKVYFLIKIQFGLKKLIFFGIYDVNNIFIYFRTKNFNVFFQKVQMGKRISSGFGRLVSPSVTFQRFSFFPFATVQHWRRSFFRNFFNFEELRKNESQGKQSGGNQLIRCFLAKLRKNFISKVAILSENVGKYFRRNVLLMVFNGGHFLDFIFNPR